VSPKARSAIRNFIKNQSVDKTIEFGRQLISRGLRRHEASIDAVDDAAVESLLKQMSLKSIDDLYYEVGLGNQIPSVVASWLLNEGDQTTEIDRKVKVNKESDPGPLIVEGGEDAIISLAKCCEPIPGDNIQGLITAIEDIRFDRANEAVTILNFTISVTDRNHLGRLIKRVRNLAAVHRARRATS